MKRLFIILVVNFLFFLTCFSQLNKYEGRWKYSKENIYFTKNEQGNLDRWNISEITLFQIDIVEGELYIRGKQMTKWYNRPGFDVTNEDYFDIKDIVLEDDGSITCKNIIHNSIEEEHERPIGYDRREKYEILSISRSAPWLDVKSSNLYIDYFKNGNLIYRFDFPWHDSRKFYNVKDNW